MFNIDLIITPGSGLSTKVCKANTSIQDIVTANDLTKYRICLNFEPIEQKDWSQTFLKEGDTLLALIVRYR